MLVERSTLLDQRLSYITLFVLTITISVLPSIYSSELYWGVMTGKMFFLIISVSVCSLYYAYNLLLKSSISIRSNLIDILLLVLSLYILISYNSSSFFVSDRFLEYLSLMILYVLIRQSPIENIKILFWGLAIGGLVQAIYGLLQLFGFFTSFHSLFKVTGTFFNPGPFGGYLMSVFPVFMGYILFAKRVPLLSKHRAFESFLYIGGSIIVLGIVGSNSRAAFLAILVSSLYLLSCRYCVFEKLLGLSLRKKIGFLITIVSIFTFSLFALRSLNTQSADGRMLIWKISTTIFKDKPILGIGFDRFKAIYMHKQANYFKDNPDSADAMLASDTTYCFNDVLQFIVENGIVGLIILATLLFFVFKVSNEEFQIELLIAKAGILGIITFALFSYPSYILPIKVSLILYIGSISVYSPLSKKIQFYLSKWKAGIVGGILLIPICFMLSVYIPRYYKAYKHWNLAYRSYQMGNYKSSIDHAKRGYPYLKNNGDFLMHYGKALSLAGDYPNAVLILKEAEKHFPNTVVYTALGDSYKGLNMVSLSAEAYQTAWYMNPARFYPRFLLAKLYDESGETEKAKIIASALLRQFVKVESEAIDEIRVEMKKIIERK